MESNVDDFDPYEQDIGNEQFDIGTTDDRIEDEEIDEGIEDEAEKDAESQPFIPSSSDKAESTKYEDDEPDSVTSESESEAGYRSWSESSLPSGRGRSRPRKSISEKPVESIPIGRGCLAISALDRFGQQLQEPGIIRADNKDYYTPKLPQARLSTKYLRKHEDPEAKNERLAALAARPALIDFNVKFSQISIIIDKDYSKEKSFEHARQRLQELVPTFDFKSLKYPYDIWHFGLYIYQINFQETEVTCNLLDLVPQHIYNEEKRPYWFTFKPAPTFIDKSFYKITNNDPNRKGHLIIIDHSIKASISEGALTSISHFCALKKNSINKRGQWYMIFYDECIDIQSFQFKYQSTDDENKSPVLNIKYKIPVDIIDRVAILSPWKNGFALYLNIKGNIHVLQRIKNPGVDRRFERQGMIDNQPTSAYTTVRFRMQLMDDEDIYTSLDRSGKITSETSDVDKKDIFKTYKEELLQKMREVFQTLIKFFSKNRIHVCFTHIRSYEISEAEILSIKQNRFQYFIRDYPLTMLYQMNFRLQAKICRSREFLSKLREYETPRFYGETTEQIDDRFYRLCLYLHRRASEYIFLDLNEEIDIAIDDFKKKYERAQLKRIPLKNFNEISTKAAYVPSIVITPTTIKIRPLKLCKLNRVLRAEQFGGYLNFALVELRDEAQRMLFASEFRALKNQILRFLTEGFRVTSNRTYRYLHHSQSQVKCKQFWFYYHNPETNYLSHDAAYVWMGNFDSERVISKHTARIALCFTSTDQCIRIPAEMVTYVRDIKNQTGEYTFSDGVGTISTHLRDEIKEYLRCKYSFSVIQIRYGGCKGTLSVDWRLDINPRYQVVIRDSMNKFTSDHDILEVCKLSAPRELHLNRQDIVLLESREIPQTTFLRLQNDEHLWLVHALLQTSIAYELLQEKLVPVFELQKIARNMNIIEEPFFIQLIITCAFNIIRELIDRTRIRMDKNKARNMFGIVDEYGVLESGQVFIQYTETKPRKLEKLNEEEEEEGKGEGVYVEICKVYTGKVVVTKNPCHHPGDLRVLDAVNHPYLRHLKDVIVFPQKGERPHSNEISGSDLDGDEYVVIWHEDLIPTTENEEPYNYDGVKDTDESDDDLDKPDEWDTLIVANKEDEPKETKESNKLKRPITRDDINEVVMRVSEQDCLGPLSNIHLAYVDKKPKGIKARVCKKLAGAISQEVDAAKTGKHPLNEEQLRKLREGLENKYPDFMKTRGKREYYQSERALGKLYRSARRAVNGWTQAINNHGNTHHMQLALSLVSNDNESADQIKSSDSRISLDPYIRHDNSAKYLGEIKSLYRIYQLELLEIINLYRFHDEIDLFCRCDSMDASVGGSRRGGLEDSGAVELQNLVERTQQQFYQEFEERRKQNRCCNSISIPTRSGRVRRKIVSCEYCANEKTAKAACAYIYTYELANKLPPKSTRRILSFPWLFASQLIHLRMTNNSPSHLPSNVTVIGQACQSYLGNLTPRFRTFIPTNAINLSEIEFSYQQQADSNSSSKNEIIRISLLQACFVEILNDWFIKQEIFGEQCIETEPKPLIPEGIWHELLIKFLSNEYIPNVRLILASKTQRTITENYTLVLKNYSQTWKQEEYDKLHEMFEHIRLLAVQQADEKKLTTWSYLDEYIILALQSIAITKNFSEKWI